MAKQNVPLPPILGRYGVTSLPTNGDKAETFSNSVKDQFLLNEQSDSDENWELEFEED